MKFDPMVTCPIQGQDLQSCPGHPGKQDLIQKDEAILLTTTAKYYYVHVYKGHENKLIIVIEFPPP